MGTGKIICCLGEQQQMCHFNLHLDRSYLSLASCSGGVLFWNSKPCVSAKIIFGKCISATQTFICQQRISALYSGFAQNLSQTGPKHVGNQPFLLPLSHALWTERKLYHTHGLGRSPCRWEHTLEMHQKETPVFKWTATVRIVQFSSLFFFFFI